MLQKPAFFLLLVLALNGCGLAYKSAAEEFIKKQPVEAWGNKPAENHREKEVLIIKAGLKDPDSAKFDFQELERGTVSASLTNPKVVPVWYSTVKVNAKNSYGGYTGYKKYIFYYHNGSLYAADSPENGRTYFKQI